MISKGDIVAFRETTFQLSTINGTLPSINLMAGTGARRPLPIIAMNAHAIKGLKERSLDSGMNG